jgi:hypothetical protein
MRASSFFVFIALVLGGAAASLVACGDDSTSGDGAPAEAGTSEDAALARDATSAIDSAIASSDAEAADAAADDAMLDAAIDDADAGAPDADADADAGSTGSLTVDVAGNGTGTVSIGGTPCAAFPCVVPYDSDASSLVVTAAASASSIFEGWSGDCAGTGACAPTTTQNRTVTATFSLRKIAVTVNLARVRGAGGTVSSSGNPALSCVNDVCTAEYDYGSDITITAAGANGGLFQSWAATCPDRFDAACATGALTAAYATTVTFRPAINYVFVTSDAVVPSTLGADLVSADKHCDDLARAAGLYDAPTNGATRFKALMSTSAIDAKDRLAGARGWIRPDGREFADSLSGLFANPATVFYPPSITETGSPVGSGVLAATGTAPTGVSSGDTCSDWTATGNGLAATLGAPVATGTEWLDRQRNLGCGVPWHLFCLETAYSTPVAPTAPANARIAFVTTGTIDGGAQLGPASTPGSADALCAAEKGGLPGTYLALLATTAASASSRFDLSGAPWVRPDGVLLASSNANLMAWNVLAPISQLASGAYVSSYHGVWVGSRSPDEKASSTTVDCNDWSDGTSGSKGFYMLSADSLWDGYEFFSLPTCNTKEHVYCLQQ